MVEASSSARIAAQIDPSGLSDVPTKTDAIGFAPYTRAIAWFLSNSKTKAPLTISIEGPWGSGKSSFMLQLEDELKKQASKSSRTSFIWFNAWRSDKDEALWAAFALTFIRQLKRQLSFFDRIAANVKLLSRRLDWEHGWLQLLKIAASWIVFVALTIYGLTHTELIASPNIGTVGFGIPWVAALLFGFRESKKLFGDPLSADLSKYLRDLKYEEKVAFIDRFQDDFADIVTSYIGAEGRVFIFIDDLDRCEVPKAAELLQAINLLLSGDQGNLFFILGLDREMVAAGIAAKNEQVLPYLAAGRGNSYTASQDSNRVGIEYGYSFMEKFVQVPFRIPSPGQREIARWVTGMAVGASKQPPESPNTSGLEEIREGSDPVGFEQVVERIARLFDFNPRRIKQFINILRLRVMVALSTGVLTVRVQTTTGGVAVGGITMEQLGMLTAILMRWPQIITDLLEDYTLLQKIASPSSGSGNLDAVVKWSADRELKEAINLDQTYSLSNVDLTPVLMIMPNIYVGNLGSRANQNRTELVSRLTIRTADPTGPDGAQGTAKTAPTGPTGAGPLGSISSEELSSLARRA